MMEQEGLFLFSMDNAIEMALVFDVSGNITYANTSAKQQLEYGEDLCGSHINEVFPDLFQETEDGTKLRLESGCEVTDRMAYRKNKTCFPVQSRIMEYGQNSGVFVCMAYDVSEKNFLEKRIAHVNEEVETALKVKSEFVANVTHELRTPVNGLLGNTKELISREDEKEKLSILRMMERGCQDMNSIINNILDFSKLEAGKFTLEMREFNFRSMVDYVKANHMNKITEKGLEFFVTISPEIPDNIIGDELHIVQVLNNLLSNACKFTSVGKIVLEVLKTAQVNNRMELFFLVIDSGIGIDKAGQDKLFKSFSQVDASISRKYGGTGLGLNICKQLVELMGGNIRVESEPGKGTMFSFSVWVELSTMELNEKQEEEYRKKPLAIPSMKELQVEGEKLHQYGEEENLREIQKKMSKLILSVEMENWEKAEMFMTAIRQLTAEAPGDVKTAVLRLKMAVQKADYEKTTENFEILQTIISQVREENL